MKTPLKLIYQVIYSFLILFISYTLMNKIVSLDSFQVNLLKTGIFSSAYIPFVSYAVIVLELGVLLMFIFYSRVGIPMMLGMLIMFTLYIVFLRITGKYEICGCGGVLNGLAFKYHFFINITLIGFAYFLYNFSFPSSLNLSSNEN